MAWFLVKFGNRGCVLILIDVNKNKEALVNLNENRKKKQTIKETISVEWVRGVNGVLDVYVNSKACSHYDRHWGTNVYTWEVEIITFFNAMFYGNYI